MFVMQCLLCQAIKTQLLSENKFKSAALSQNVFIKIYNKIFFNVPKWLSRYQMLFHQNMGFERNFIRGITRLGCHLELLIM